MIIILGPDCSGKTSLAQSFDLRYTHYIKESNYDDYLSPLANLELFDAVTDRFILCEWPYATIMQRKFKFTTKQWHNIILLALAQNPLIVLCTHKPTPAQYTDNYLPYGKWDLCLGLYKRILHFHHINYVEYDYTSKIRPSVFSIMESRYRGRARWWVPMWKAGIGSIGSQTPKILLVAQNMGPSNTHLLPFECGPTGLMLSEVLERTRTPLGDIAITNMVKAPRGTNRDVNTKDLELFKEELVHLKPKKIIFMGKIAQQAGIPIAKSMNIPYAEIVHLGSLAHQGIHDLTNYCKAWEAAIGEKKGVWR